MVLNDNPAALYYLHAYGVRILAIHILASGRVRGGGRGEKKREIRRRRCDLYAPVKLQNHTDALAPRASTRATEFFAPVCCKKSFDLLVLVFKDFINESARPVALPGRYYETRSDSIVISSRIAVYSVSLYNQRRKRRSRTSANLSKARFLIATL